MAFIYSNAWQNNDKRRCPWYFFLAIAFILSGCAVPATKVTHRHPETRPQVVSPKEQTPTPSPLEIRPPDKQETVFQPTTEFSSEDTVGPVSPDAKVTAVDDLAANVPGDYIKQRLIIYEKKLQQWLDLYPQNTTNEKQRSFFETDPCQDKLNAVLSGYTNLHSQLQLTTLSTDLPKPQSTFQEILKLDIAFLESECEQRLTHSAVQPTQGSTQGMDPGQEAREAERILLDESVAHQWKSANNLLDSQQFDPAIAGFTSLLNTSYDAKAREKIQVATNLAAAAQRKQAASLFIKAVKERSPENKTLLLLESKQCLQEVLRKYPQADIIDKVAQNLTTIEQHIAQLIPHTP